MLVTYFLVRVLVALDTNDLRNALVSISVVMNILGTRRGGKFQISWLVDTTRDSAAG